MKLKIIISAIDLVDDKDKIVTRRLELFCLWHIFHGKIHSVCCRNIQLIYCRLHQRSTIIEFNNIFTNIFGQPFYLS
jgi:hypothetical protein